MAAVSGHTSLRRGKRGAQWYAKYRLPDGRQVQRRLGPAWEEAGRPPAGHLTRKMAEAALQAILTDARRGTLEGMTRVEATFGDAVGEWLRYAEHDRRLKHSTLVGYRSISEVLERDLDPDTPLGEITTTKLEHLLARLVAERRLSAGTFNKYMIVLNGIFKRAVKVYGLSTNPVAGIESQPQVNTGDTNVFTPTEVHALVRAADTDHNATIFFTAAFTGLRMGELLALHWHDVDFARQSIHVRHSYSAGAVTTPKSGKVRTVPMVDDVAQRLAKLTQREHFTDDEDLVFGNERGEHSDPYQLGRRYHSARKRAGLRRIRFHDLRHTFGTLAIERASILQVKEWMGHSKIETTMRYLHHKSRHDDADLLAEAFRAADIASLTKV